ncbi:MAG: hypothetical protein GIKADHBN_01095 [Phycisphaerales bacterium]|nr:hypothetical protein [Phycisphaerales bacterium]MCK6475753.1 hypothetical protein [Phycisphaerales bacterium]
MSPADSVKIMCPKLTCRKVLSVPATARGRTVRCRVCGTAIRVPAAKPKSADPVPDPKKP